MSIWSSNVHVGLLVTHLVVNILHICPFMFWCFRFEILLSIDIDIFSIRWFRFRCIDFSLSVSFSSVSFPSKNIMIGNDNAYFRVSDRFHPYLTVPLLNRKKTDGTKATSEIKRGTPKCHDFSSPPTHPRFIF
jgi:hypothetical protein